MNPHSHPTDFTMLPLSRSDTSVRTEIRRHCSARTLVAALLALALRPAVALADGGHHPLPATLRDARAVSWNRTVMPRATAAALAAVMVPGFSRQTGLPCAACHNQFPQLNAFGRMFKLNGYTLTTLNMIRAKDSDTTKRETLALLPIPPLSAMVVASLTATRSAVPGTQNGTASFPQQASLFLAGAITPKIGVFSQVTYSAASGSVGIDNMDIRFADHAMVGGEDVLYGVTLNNNPTVQDVWNTVPAWGFPFMSSGAAPSTNAAALIDGGLGQQVLGLGAYALWKGALYTELTAYRSAPQGFGGPLDSSAVNTASGVIPYWRVTLQHKFDAATVMIGTYGLAASVHPSGVAGPTNRHTDLGIDAQFEQPAGDGGAVIVRGNVIRENRTLDALTALTPAGAANGKVQLTTVRLNATYQPNLRYGFTAGLFGTGGTSDTLLYAPGPVSGSASGSPSSRGYLAELAVNPWQNVRLAAQYVGFTRFNGGSQDYDGSGRSAANNGTLYLYTWLAY
jgi:hypothetical protein